jgi:hypothetical protein
MDRIFLAFLENTAADAAELQQKSDLLTLRPVPPLPPSRYACRFRVPYLRRLPTGTVEIDPGPVDCTISFPPNYLRSTDRSLGVRVASIASPGFVHPNVLHGAVCLGQQFAPGTPIQALVWELFEIVTYRNCTLDHGLNPEACRLIREYPSLLERMGRPSLFRSDRSIRVSVRSAR